MDPRALPLLSRASAALGAGAITGLSINVGTELFGSGPVACVASAAIGLAGCALAVRRTALAPALAAVGALAIWQAESVGRVAFAVLAPGSAMYACAAFLALALGCISAGSGGALARAPAGAAGAVIVASAWLPREALVLMALVGALGAGRAPGPAAAADEPSGTARAFAVFPAIAVVIAVWIFRRAGVDPTSVGWTALMGALVVGAGAPRGRGSLALGGLALTAAGWGLLREPELLVARGTWATALAFAGSGAGAGLLIGGLGAARGALPTFVLIAATLPFALRAVPTGVSEAAARTLATTWAQRGRADSLREGATLLYAGLGPSGAATLRRAKDSIFVELDGAFAEPASRAGDAERFAGTLAACATAGRGRARLGGDDLGLATAGLRAQGFLHLDVAVPDTRLARAQAAALPSLERLWLHPAVRLLAMPAPIVLRSGERADAVIELARNAWSGGRTGMPSRRGLRAARATLAPGGVHVVALGATGLDAAVFRGLLRDFAAVYPAASLWLPPSGADAAILLGPRDPGVLAWSGFAACAAADVPGLKSLALRSAADIGALAISDASGLRALPPGRAAGPGLPASLRLAPALHLSIFADARLDPALLFSADAPLEDLRARGEARALFLHMAREATSGDVKEAIEQARALAALPGGARALEPLVRPHLARVRERMAAAARQGTTSPLWEQAEAALSTARFIYPQFPDTRCLEGELAGARGQFARAEEAFTACAELDAERIDAWDGLARVRRSRGNRVGTEAALRSGLAARPELWSASHNLGVFLLEMGRYDEAERLLKQAAALQARESAPLAAPLLALARLHLAVENAPLALAEAQRALGMTRTADALALRGAAHFDLRHIDQAEVDFRDALALEPTHVLARGGLGQVQWTRGQHGLAAASFRAVLAVEPRNVQAAENLRRLGPLLKEAP